MKDVYRPSHADWTTEAKYGIRNWQGGGRASARETIGRVAAGAVARKLLRVAAGVEVLAWVSQVYDVDAKVDERSVTLAQVEANPVRCPDPEAAARMEQQIDAARRRGDSLGGVVTCVARGVPAGSASPSRQARGRPREGPALAAASKGSRSGAASPGRGSPGASTTTRSCPARTGARTRRAIARAACRAASRTASRSSCASPSSRPRRSASRSRRWTAQATR